MWFRALWRLFIISLIEYFTQELSFHPFWYARVYCKVLLLLICVTYYTHLTASNANLHLSWPPEQSEVIQCFAKCQLHGPLFPFQLKTPVPRSSPVSLLCCHLPQFAPLPDAVLGPQPFTGHRGLDTVHSCYLLLAESQDWSGLFWFALFYQNTLDCFAVQSTWYQYPHPGQSNYHRSLVLKTFSLSPLPIPTSHLSLFCVFNLDKLNFLLPSYSSPKPLLSFRESVSTSQSSTSLVGFDYKIWHVFSLHCLMICFQGLALPMWCIHFIMKCHSAAVIKNHSTANPMHI